MERLLVIVILCASIGYNNGQEEIHLPDYLVFMKQFMVNIQIREPAGIMIWTRDSSLIEMFGIELFVSRNNHSQHKPIWDRQLLVNTSVTTDGKFMIADNDLVIETGEIIRYRFSILHKGIFSHSNYHRILVTDHIFYRSKDNICQSECLVSDQNTLHEETARLKSILEQKISDCVGSQTSEHLYFRLENAENLVADTQLFVKYRLWQIDALRPLVDKIVTTYLARNGVGVRMKTPIDKLKVLELAKGKLDVTDLDAFLHDNINY